MKAISIVVKATKFLLKWTPVIKWVVDCVQSCPLIDKDSKKELKEEQSKLNDNG